MHKWTMKLAVLTAASATMLGAPSGTEAETIRIGVSAA